MVGVRVFLFVGVSAWHSLSAVVPHRVFFVGFVKGCVMFCVLCLL